MGEAVATGSIRAGPIGVWVRSEKVDSRDGNRECRETRRNCGKSGNRFSCRNPGKNAAKTLTWALRQRIIWRELQTMSADPRKWSSSEFGVSAVLFLWIPPNLIFLGSAGIDFSDSWLCCFSENQSANFGPREGREQSFAVNDQSETGQACVSTRRHGHSFKRPEANCFAGVH